MSGFLQFNTQKAWNYCYCETFNYEKNIGMWPESLLAVRNSQRHGKLVLQYGLWQSMPMLFIVPTSISKNFLQWSIISLPASYNVLAIQDFLFLNKLVYVFYKRSSWHNCFKLHIIWWGLIILMNIPLTSTNILTLQ